MCAVSLRLPRQIATEVGNALILGEAVKLNAMVPPCVLDELLVNDVAAVHDLSDDTRIVGPILTSHELGKFIEQPGLHPVGKRGHRARAGETTFRNHHAQVSHPRLDIAHAFNRRPRMPQLTHPPDPSQKVVALRSRFTGEIERPASVKRMIVGIRVRVVRIDVESRRGRSAR